MLKFELPWDSQPQEVVGIDWNNPLTQGLLIAILPQLPVNLADGVALSAHGTRVVSGGVKGLMNTSGGMLLPAPVNASDPSAKYDLSSGTALVVAVQSTETNTGVVFNRSRGSAAPLWAIGLHGGSFDGAHGSWGNSGYLGIIAGGPVPTIPRVATITADGATARVYLDGVELQSGAYTPGTPEYDTANLRRVLFGLNQLGVNTNTNTFLALLWNRPLSAAEVKEVSGNPWQIFAPRTIWVPVSAGGGGTPTLTVPDTSHAHTLDNVVLTSSTALVVQDMAHGHALDAATLSTGTALTVADAQHAHALDAVVLTSQTDLAAADMAHGHALDGVTLTLGGASLTAADLLHGHAMDGAALTLDTFLAAFDLLHGHALDGDLNLGPPAIETQDNSGGWPIYRRKKKKDDDEEELEPAVIEAVAVVPAPRRMVTLEKLIGKKAAAQVNEAQLSSAIRMLKRKRQDEELMLM